MNNVYISKNCKIDQCILMDECGIEEDIVLPPGSIVGPRCNVNEALVQHSIRCFFQHLWNKDEIYSRFTAEGDYDYLTQFLNRKISISAEYILRMPPVFMMR